MLFSADETTDLGFDTACRQRRLHAQGSVFTARSTGADHLGDDTTTT